MVRDINISLVVLDVIKGTYTRTNASTKYTGFQSDQDICLRFLDVISGTYPT
jgi:hypothetical protein